MTTQDDHKRFIKGFRGHSRSRQRGSTKGGACPCCRETTKRKATRLARRRLRQADSKAHSNSTQP